MLCKDQPTEPIRQRLDKELNVFIEHHVWFINSLHSELVNALVKVGEHKTRVACARYVVGEVIEEWIPIYDYTHWTARAIGRSRMDLTFSEEGKLLSATQKLEEAEMEVTAENSQVVDPLQFTFFKSIQFTVDTIYKSAPEVYAEKEEELSRFLHATSRPEPTSKTITINLFPDNIPPAPLPTDIALLFLDDYPTPPDQAPEPEVKKSKKKSAQLTTKQQMILLDLLEFLNAPILDTLTVERKSKVLANLLNRSEQEVRMMLTYWAGKPPKEDYNCTNPDDIDRVTDFLIENGVQV